MAHPRRNALEPTLAQFEAYDGGIMTSQGWIILPIWDIRDNKFHPVRYYVVTREEARILISHATVTWMGLVKVLCPNKAPRIKRQVASVSKKAKEPSESNNSNSLSGSEHPPKVKYFYMTRLKHHNILPKRNTQVRLRLKSNNMNCQLLSHVATGGDDAEADRPHREEEDQVDNTSCEVSDISDQ